MTMQSQDRDPLMADQTRRIDELERERIEAMERGVADAGPDSDDFEPRRELTGAPVAGPGAILGSEDPDISGSVVEPAEPSTDPRVGGAVVGGALGAVAGAIVGGPAGAIVGGAVGAAGGAVVAGNNNVDDGTVVDIDHPEMSSQIRRPADEELVDR
jgi:hypothetical protein